MKQLSTIGASVLLLIFLMAPMGAQSAAEDPETTTSRLSTSGSFSIVPITTWGSGDLHALTDK
jgi:hypothetical protein